MPSSVHNASSKTQGDFTEREYVGLALRTGQTAYAVRQGAARFWGKVEIGTADVCWRWKAALYRTGYGQVAWNGRGEGAHRVAWMLANGRPIPAGLSALHKCDNRWCVNPSHLFLGDQVDNMRDAARKGRLSVPRPRAQMFTDADVDGMRELYRAGMLQKDIAAKFGCTRTYVSYLIRGLRRTEASADAEGARASLRRTA